MKNTEIEKILKEKVGEGYKQKKVLLVALDSPFLDNQYVFPYLGILYLLSVAKSVGMKSQFVDKANPVTEELIKEFDVFYTDEFDFNRLEDYRHFDLIGISCMTPQGKDAYKVRAALTEKFPDVVTLIGGPHAKHYKTECQNEGFDFVIIGDGERLFENLLRGNQSFIKEKVSPGSNPKSLVLLDDLSEVEMNFYPEPFREASYLDKYSYKIEGLRSTTIINSRGCPMGCVFCEDRRTIGRWFDPDHFEQEIKDILALGIQGIMIFDDLFAISAKKIRPYTDILKKYHHSHGLIYRCFGHAGTMHRNPEMAKLLGESGCVEIGFGAESASQPILDVINKGTKIHQMHSLIEHCVAAGIRVKAFFMIGLPSESEETFQDTYDFIKKYRDLYPSHFDFDFAAFFPYKGTIVGDCARLKDGETIKESRFELHNKSFQIRAIEGLSWSEIDNGVYGAYKKKLGASDIVVETYDWEKGEVLLSAARIEELKDKMMELSGRYSLNMDNEKVLNSEGSMSERDTEKEKTKMKAKSKAEEVDPTFLAG
jgi:radical SAM superfamily enzyme YgiQ (UPF0313 family)